jgi:hypothetical protein
VKNLANFLLFQAGWFACVMAAADGQLWLGPLAVLGVVVLHLAFVTQPEHRRRELGYIIAVGLLGLLADTGLGWLGATHYPTSEEVGGLSLAPPWIVALWVLFATLPHHSLSWLTKRPWLSVVFGAFGGPLSYLAGVRMGAVAVGESALLTWGALAIEYALVTPLMLHFARSEKLTMTRVDKLRDPSI